MMQTNKLLSQQTIKACASGKAILIGEHSVVYGCKAIAMALPDIKLTLTLEKPGEILSHWNQVWHTIVQNKEVVLEERITKVLTQAFEKALLLVQFSQELTDFIPQKILIDSQIPLGGGMGGSAAISTCLIRIAAQLANKKLLFEQETEFANEVDCLFHHGKASGLDVSAVASNGMIEFQKGSLLKKIENKCRFWIALIDSGERSETAQMIQKVKKMLEINPEVIEKIFTKLNSLACSCAQFLEQGQLFDFAECLNEAQDCLFNLEVSTPKMDNIVRELKKQGALAAKLTGAGGGGLVLSVFSEKPTFLFGLYSKDKVYLTEVRVC